MDTEVDFYPKTLNLRKFVLRETEKFFVLMGTDKALRKQSIITIVKKDDNQVEKYELEDIIIEDMKAYDPG